MYDANGVVVEFDMDTDEHVSVVGWNDSGTRPGGWSHAIYEATLLDGRTAFFVWSDPRRSGKWWIGMVDHRLDHNESGKLDSPHPRR